MTKDQKKRQDLTFAKMRAEAKNSKERADVEIKISRILRNQTQILKKKIKDE